MEKMPSTEFRNRYPSLDEPTIVTVNGRPIGTWTPGPWGTLGALVKPSAHLQEIEKAFSKRQGWPVAGAQAQRDAILRKVNTRK
jgi:hypothetical protein